MKIADVETPALLIDLDRAEANMKRAQDYADAHDLPLRPHIKTHRLPRFAKAQITLGARGITCQKLGEAEVMADAGIADILVTYNILGTAKLDRLADLHARIRIAVVADNAPVIEGYQARFDDPDHPLGVMVECDTGAGRNGVQTPEEALVLARMIDAAPGLRFLGLMTYPPRDDRVGARLAGMKEAIEADGIAVREISSGGSPGLYSAHETAGITEYRPGTYIYSDRMQVAAGLGTLEDCALSVLATVVSRPTAERAVLDAGSKALAADLSALPGHGHVMGHPDAVLTGLSEEHAVVDISACKDFPAIGEKVRIVPNHACVVTNLFDSARMIRGSGVEETVRIAARGCSQ
ncbi:D-serine deaminase-like pyridoxal phosphate-dependent protein [Palleronia aestuarii]|uniref:D-serine deaminase-like pyridoxal phosphate-dependent protein n=1 Tax=Palleronia aestuarii TaxID=568105 RepID=A0A2W7MZS2_9RHOB|nr:D-TA family PLP-dependent enzyme [Palleronia aestuarii]PZX13655.1 D-serine deaminase-like pyridoxal phosphate-dependent protein [Palleronia aestuarii]